MRTALALLPLLLIGAADKEETERAEADQQSTIEPTPSTTPRIEMPNAQASDDDRCADRVRQVRRDRGLPELRREPAEPGDATMWYAVDRRIEGCTVLVRHGNPDDVRPFPEIRDGPLFRRVPVGDE